jgi:hypothetical protein
MNGGMEQARRLTQVRGAAAVGLYPFFSFPFFLLNSFCSISQLSFVSGDER